MKIDGEEIGGSLPYQIYRVIRGRLGKIRRKMRRFYDFRMRYPYLYKKYARKPIDETKVVFIEVRHPRLTNSLEYLYEDLKKNYQFNLHVHLLETGFVKRSQHMKNGKAMIEDIADAKYVFLSDACNIVANVPIREETIVTQTWHGCGAFKKFGMSTGELIFGDSMKDMIKYPNHKNYTHVTVSSKEVIWAYEEAMNLKSEDQVVKATGISRTDVFFDSRYIEDAKQKLEQLMPTSKGKKVILYAPTFRGRVVKATSPNCFDIAKFYEKFADEYVLLFKHHPLVKKRPVIAEEYKEFAMDCTETLSIEELICVSDICISDYSSLIFEYSLFEKPMLFYAYDLDKYFDWRGFYYDYHELAPGPICTTNEEMIEYIENIEENFEKEKVVAFKNKFMESCDGHATERIEQMVFGNDLKKYAR